jgi:hypothetical protein
LVASFAASTLIPCFALAQDSTKEAKPGSGSSGAPIRVNEHSAPADRPEPPRGPRISAPEQVEVAQMAGVGSPLAYARATVVELGGTLALVHDSDTTTFRIARSIGYLPVDNQGSSSPFALGSGSTS